MKLQYIGITLLLVSAMLAASAQAGQVTIHNDNCAPLFQSSVQVHVYDATDRDSQGNSRGNCTDIWKDVSKGSNATLQLLEGNTCTYAHEAEGTVGGSRDVSGSVSSSVTCSNDWLGVCQCTKD
jgi:hypothetical protein